MALGTVTQERVPAGTDRSPRFLAALVRTVREAGARRLYVRHHQVSPAPLRLDPVAPEAVEPRPAVRPVPPPAASSPVVPPLVLLPLLALRPVSIPSPWVPFDVEQWSRNAGGRPE